MQVDLFVGFGHLGFFADFLDFAVFDGYAAVDDFLFRYALAFVRTESTIKVGHALDE